MISVRYYNPDTDYLAVELLYKNSATFGGQYDNARDTKERLKLLSDNKPGSILVAERNKKIVGTVTLFEDGRSAWFYRFAVDTEDEEEITKELNKVAKDILKKWGHEQVLVYAPVDNKKFEDRYEKLGFVKGANFTAYWQDLD